MRVIILRVCCVVGHNIRGDDSRCVDVTADVIDNDQHVHIVNNNSDQWRLLEFAM